MWLSAHRAQVKRLSYNRQNFDSARALTSTQNRTEKRLTKPSYSLVYGSCTLRVGMASVPIPIRQRDSGRYGMLPRFLLLGGPRLLIMKHLFFFFFSSNPIPKDYLLAYFKLQLVNKNKDNCTIHIYSLQTWTEWISFCARSTGRDARVQSHLENIIHHAGSRVHVCKRFRTLWLASTKAKAKWFTYSS